MFSIASVVPSLEELAFCVILEHDLASLLSTDPRYEDWKKKTARCPACRRWTSVNIQYTYTGPIWICFECYLGSATRATMRRVQVICLDLSISPESAQNKIRALLLEYRGDYCRVIREVVDALLGRSGVDNHSLETDLLSQDSGQNVDTNHDYHS